MGVRSAIAALVLMAFMPTVVMAQAFDWSAQLGKSPFDLEATLSQAGDCATGSFSVPIKNVTKDTYLSDNLFDPVVTSYGFIPVNGSQDGISDYDNSRTFSSKKVTSIQCTIGLEASVQIHAFEDHIVRIKLTFDRCRERETRQYILSRPTADKCVGTDLTTKDYDEALYQAIEARNTYGYDTRWSKEELRGPLESKKISGEFEAAEFRVLWDVNCPSLPIIDGDRIIIPFDRKFRCLIDVDNEDPARWSVTAMHEIVRPGMFVDTVERRLAAMRLFVDMPAERSAALAIRPELQTVIDGIKAEIAVRAAAERTKRDAVSNILGGGN
jgi:hypothetical protein